MRPVQRILLFLPGYFLFIGGCAGNSLDVDVSDIKADDSWNDSIQAV